MNPGLLVAALVPGLVVDRPSKVFKLY